MYAIGKKRKDNNNNKNTNKIHHNRILKRRRDQESVEAMLLPVVKGMVFFFFCFQFYFIQDQWSIFYYGYILCDFAANKVFLPLSFVLFASEVSLHILAHFSSGNSNYIIRI